MFKMNFNYSENKETMNELTPDIMYRAIVEKDPSFEGLFFTAVKTTGIFCRPTCPARKPKIENVEFFTSVKACILKGYLLCKVCRPLESLNQTPKDIQSVLTELAENPALRFKDADLRQKALNPAISDVGF